MDKQGDIINRHPVVEDVDIVGGLMRVEVNHIDYSIDGNCGHISLLFDEGHKVGRCPKYNYIASKP